MLLILVVSIPVLANPPRDPWDMHGGDYAYYSGMMKIDWLDDDDGVTAVNTETIVFTDVERGTVFRAAEYFVSVPTTPIVDLTFRRFRYNNSYNNIEYIDPVAWTIDAAVSIDLDVPCDGFVVTRASTQATWVPSVLIGGRRK